MLKTTAGEEAKCNFLPYLLNPHFFDAGEEGGGFEAQEFRSSAGAVDFPACFV